MVVPARLRPGRPATVGGVHPLTGDPDRSSRRRRVPVRGVLLAAGGTGRGEAPPFEVMAGLARAAESAGFDGVWVPDALPGAGSPGSPAYEAFTLLGALATVTGSVVLGALGSPVDRRPPAVLAKIVTTLDALSGGRAVVALAPPAGGAPDPTGQVEESILAFRLVAAGEPATLAGRYVHLDGAVSRPPAVRAEGVPLLVSIDPGLAGAARLAGAGDGWVASGGSAAAGLAGRLEGDRAVGDGGGSPPVSLAVLDAHLAPADVVAAAHRAFGDGFTGVVVPVDPSDSGAEALVAAAGPMLTV